MALGVGGPCRSFALEFGAECLGLQNNEEHGLALLVLRADNPWLSHCLCLDVPKDEGHKHRNTDTECLEAPGRLHARSLSIDSCCVQLCAVGEPAIGYFLHGYNIFVDATYKWHIINTECQAYRRNLIETIISFSDESRNRT